MNVALWLQRTALATPKAPALFRGKEQVADYNQLAARSAAIAQGLRATYGIEPGDRVGIFMANNVEYLPQLFGIWWAGAVVVPINAKLHAVEAAWILSNAGVKAAFVGHDGMMDGSSDQIGFPQLVAGSAEYRALLDHPALAEPIDRSDTDLAWLFYTSGTTGRPKGVMLSHGNLIAMTQAFLLDVDLPRRGSANYYAAPMSHGAGLYCLAHVLRGNGHVVPTSRGFSPAELLALAEHFGDLSLFAVPTMVKRLTDHARQCGANGAGLGTIVYGGGPMYAADIEAATAIFGPRFVQIYGQGETPMTITTLPRATIVDRTHVDWRDRLASVGMPFTATEVCVTDRSGQPLPPGETGEILVRGATVMQGYWNDPEATAAALRAGWLWTGDMGALSQDGYLTLKDRSKDVIISGGTNIYPREVEEALLTHPDVEEACVIGYPDPEWGEEVLAFVVPRAGVVLDEAMLDAHCLTRIARFKRPKQYRFVADLPKSDYGKILKTVLRSRLETETPSR